MDAGPTVRRVVVCSDAFLEREGIAHVLQRAADVDVVGLARSGEEAFLAVGLGTPDVLVVRVAMAPTFTYEGIWLARRLRHDYPAMGVVALGPGVYRQDALRLLGGRACASAYLIEERLSFCEELLGAIREVALGGVVDSAVLEAPMRARHADDALLDRLTSREFDVLALVAEGLSNATIALQLSLSKRAVEKHIREIFARFDLRASPAVSRRVAAALVFLHERDCPPPTKSHTSTSVTSAVARRRLPLGVARRL